MSWGGGMMVTPEQGQRAAAPGSGGCDSYRRRPPSFGSGLAYTTRPSSLYPKPERSQRSDSLRHTADCNPIENLFAECESGLDNMHVEKGKAKNLSLIHI